jgi:hypothetical protein
VRRKRPFISPLAPGKPGDYYFYPTPEERLLAALADRKKQWDAEDDARIRRGAAEIALVVEQDREWLSRERAFEDRVLQIQTYYESERKKEEQAADKRRLARFKQITAEINADICRTERVKLAARGLIRGTR